MKSTAIVCAIAAASMGFGSLSYAQDQRGPRTEQRTEQRAERPDHRAGQRGDHREARGDVREARRDIGEGRRDLREARNDRNDVRHDGRQADNRYQRDFSFNHYGHHRHYAAHNPQFYRGGTLPQHYRSGYYVVNDWRGHHLSAPPYGHQWVQVGSDYVLVAVATGLIASLLINQ